ncbi:MAG: dTMP kinase [Desulfobacterales bacterium]|nr:dTMP kinase [Desulfobacterales bacterium]
MFITLEGIEGSGKTSQTKHMARFLQSAGHVPVITREPGGTRIGEKIRAILLDPETKGIAPIAELLLYVADRAQHISELIRPLLAEGKTVICDRYFDATMAYQGFARKLDTNLIIRLHHLLFENLKPDITFLLDLPAQKGLERAWKQIDNGIRTGRESRFEKEALSFHEQVRKGYLELARQDPGRFCVIDASGDECHVRDEIIQILKEKMN